MKFESYASNQIYKYAKSYGVIAKPISYEDSLIELEYKGKKELIKQVATRFTNIIQGRICDNKFLAIHYLKRHGIDNVPYNIVIEQLEEITQQKIPYPVVVKPLKGHGGKGISVGIKSKKELDQAFNIAKKFCDRVLIEEYVQGDDYRFLVVGQNVRACKRIPPIIVGNGKDTIQNLIQKENIIRKNIEHLSDIHIDNELKNQIKQKGYTLRSVLPKNQYLPLRKNANLSTGGTNIDYTENIHPKNKLLALKIAKIMDMKIIAIDFLFKDPTKPYSKDNGIAIEINDTPGLRLHYPREKEIVYSILRFLFPKIK